MNDQYLDELKEVRKVIESVRIEVTEISTTLCGINKTNGLIGDMKIMKSNVDNLRFWQAKIIGGAIVISVIFSVLTTIFMKFF